MRWQTANRTANKAAVITMVFTIIIKNQTMKIGDFEKYFLLDGR